MSHPTTMFVKPAPGLRVRDPQTERYLSESGQLTPRSGFWLRRLADGDVVEVAPGLSARTATPGNVEQE